MRVLLLFPIVGVGTGVDDDARTLQRDIRFDDGRILNGKGHKYQELHFLELTCLLSFSSTRRLVATKTSIASRLLLPHLNPSTVDTMERSGHMTSRVCTRVVMDEQ